MWNGKWKGGDAEVNAGYMRNQRTKSGKGSTSEADWVAVCLSKGHMMQRQVDDPGRVRVRIILGSHNTLYIFTLHCNTLASTFYW